MDITDLLSKFFNTQSISCNVFLHSSLLPIWNIQKWKWKISKKSFKWGLSYWSVDHSVIRMLCRYQCFIPSLWVLLVVTPQKLHQIHVDYFCLSICLWMECCRSLQLCVHLFPQCSPECTQKSCIIVSNDAPWYPKVYPDLSKEQVCCFLSTDGLFTWHKNTHLAKLVNYHE